MPKSADREDTYTHLNSRVPDHLKFDLHVLLVQYGKDHKNSTKALLDTVKKLEGECEKDPRKE